MRKAIEVDDDQFFKVQEKLAQLEVRTDTVVKERSSLRVSRLPVFVSRTYNNQKFGVGVRKCRT